MRSNRLQALGLAFGLAALACQNATEASPDADPSMFATGVCLRGWCWEQPLPFGPRLPRGFWAASPDDAWAVVGRDLVRWHDQRWNVERDEVEPPLDGTDAGTVIVATDDGAMHFDGTQWRPMAGCPRPVALWSAAPGDAWLASVERNQRHLNDVTLYRWNGASCEAFRFFEDAEWALLDGAGPDDGWLALSFRSEAPPSQVRGQVLRWNGSTWTAVLDTTSVGQLVAVSPDLAWLTADSALWRWDGATWSETTIPYVQHLWFAGPTDGWATTGHGAAPARSGSVLRWDGKDWSTVRSEPDYPVYLLGASGSDLLETLAGGRGARWNGDAWTSTLPDTEALDLIDIAVGPSGEAWAVSAGALLRGSEGVWRLVAREGGAAVWSGVEGEAWVAGASGLRRWAGGLHTVSPPAGVDGPFVAVWGVAPEDVFVATTDVVSRRSSSGWVWSRPRPAEIGPIQAIHASGPDDVWVLGASGVARLAGDGWEVTTPRACSDGLSSSVLIALDDLWVEAPGRPVVVGRGSHQYGDLILDKMSVWRRGEEGWTCDIVASGWPAPRIAACDGEVWIASQAGGVGKVVVGTWEPSDVAGVPTAITCRAEMGFWTAGRRGQIAHRP